MFEFVQKHRGFVGVAFGLVILGLMMTGGSATLMGDGGAGTLAKVDGVEVTERDLQTLAGGQQVPEAEKPKMVEQLVQRQLMMNQAKELNVLAADAQLREQIGKIDAFKGEDGKFSIERYKSMLASRNMTVAQFEQLLGEDMRMQTLVDSLGSSGFGSRLAAERLVTAVTQPREVTALVFGADKFMPQAVVSDAEVKQYYDSHQADYRLPERVKLSYVVFSRDALLPTTVVTLQQLQEHFEKNKAELAQEERQVRHILIKADAAASKDAKAAAKQKAEKLLAELKQNPARFADLAKQNSEDPGSAVQGGDLGYNRKGVMVKAFDDAAFKLAKGELSGVVETEYGYHILQLQDVRSKSFEELKPSIEQSLRAELAQKRFDAETEKFTDMAYQQANSLQPLVDAYKLPLVQSDWVSREASADPMLNDKVREAVFGDDVLNKKHNSEAIEVSKGTLLVARVAAHEKARIPPLAEVAGKISDLLKREKAVKLAQAEGKKTLAALQAGTPVALEWTPSRPISRLRSEGLDKPAINAIFAAKLPGYAGVENKDSYIVFKVSAATAAPMDPAMRQNLVGSLEQVTGRQTVEAYIAELRKKQKVEIAQTK